MSDGAVERAGRIGGAGRLIGLRAAKGRPGRDREDLQVGATYHDEG